MAEVKGRLQESQKEENGRAMQTADYSFLLNLLRFLTPTAAAYLLASCAASQVSSGSPQETALPLEATATEVSNLPSSQAELFKVFAAHQIETDHRLSTLELSSSGEGAALSAEKLGQIDTLVNKLFELSQEGTISNFSADAMRVDQGGLGQAAVVEDTLVFDFGRKGTAGMFLVNSETGNKAYYLSNNGETATQIIFLIKYKDGTSQAFFDPKQVSEILENTDPEAIQSTSWTGVFQRPAIMGDNPADNFFATTIEIAGNGENRSFIYEIVEYNGKDLALAVLDPGTLDLGSFRVDPSTPDQVPFGNKFLAKLFPHSTPVAEDPVVVESQPAPVAESTLTAEATPTQSAEQIEQSIMDQFVSGPLYDQYIADNQIPEQAATAFYEEYPGADGEPFAVVTMKVDPNSLSKEQKALNIPQRDYLVVKTADGQIEFKLLPANLQLETFSQSAVEFTLSKEYQQGLQDYLNAMGLQEEDVTITEEVKVINGQEYKFLVTIPDQAKLTPDLPLIADFYELGTPFMIAKKEENGEWIWRHRSILADLFKFKGINFGFTYRMKNNQYRKGEIAPDDLLASISAIITPEDNFYQPFIFNPQPTKWSIIDEYINFLNRYPGVISGAPHLYFASGANDEYPHTSQDKQELISRTKQIVAKYGHIIKTWDINELFNENGSLRNPKALENARAVIQTIRDTDPTAIVLINDWAMESQPGKDTALYNFVTQLMNEGLLKEGDIIGYQGHNGINYQSNPEQFARWFDKYATLGFKLRITEADFIDANGSLVDETKKARIIMDYYLAGKILEQKFGHSVLDGIIMWGSTDNSSWYEDENRSGGYPLLLNNNGDPHLSWYLIANELWSEFNNSK